MQEERSRTQAVKGVDQKSTGLCPRRFESCRLRLCKNVEMQGIDPCTSRMLSERSTI